jgi:3-oxoacyl-[acyl-carrier protein] reductase
MGVLEGRVALVTGAARGIGRATAAALAAQGARVVISDIDREETETTAAELGFCVVGHVGDLTEAGVAEEAVERASSTWGRLDIVVNNAGYTLDAPLHKLDVERFQRMLDIHVLVPFRVLKAAAPLLREPAKQEREAGTEVFRKVVNISSVSGVMGNAGQTNYAAAKAGIVGLTKALAKEWGPLKINVNAVAFGFVETRLTAEKNGDSTVDIGGNDVHVGIPEAGRRALAAAIPLGRAASPEEAAGAVAFLCGPGSDYVSGQVLNVTGGLAIGMSS